MNRNIVKGLIIIFSGLLLINYLVGFNKAILFFDAILIIVYGLGYIGIHFIVD